MGQGTIREELLCRSMDIIYRCSLLCSNFHYYEQYNVVDILLEFRNDISHLKDNTANITALFTVVHLMFRAK